MNHNKLFFGLLILASTLFVQSAQATKLSEAQLQDWNNQFDNTCKLNFQQSPAKGLEEPADIEAVCACSHTETKKWLKDADFNNPADPDAIDLGKIAYQGAQISFQCLKATAKAKFATKVCLRAEKHASFDCACVGKAFTKLEDDAILEKLSPDTERPKQVNAWLVTSFSQCIKE